MPGAKGAYHQIERFRQPLLKLVEASTSLKERPAERREAQQRPGKKSPDYGSAKVPVNQIGREYKAGRGHGKQASPGPLEISLTQQAVQQRPQLELQQPLIEPWDGAERLALAQIEDLLARFRAFGGQGRV